MVFNKFRVNVVARVLLLAASMFLSMYLYLHTHLTYTTIIVTLAVLIQAWGLIYHVEQSNRVLIDFLQSVKYSDFTKPFRVKTTGTTFDKLQLIFNDVIRDFQTVKAEKEESFYYLQTVVQHIGIALIAYQKDGSVELINNATKKMFRVSNMANINSLKEEHPELVLKLLEIKHGENMLVKTRLEDELLQLSVYGTEFKIQNRTIFLVSIKNIQHELDENELESWHVLIRVLTHEIMNSITPISSLSHTVNILIEDVISSLQSRNYCTDEIESLSEIGTALKTIHSRTDGLIHFVNTYHDLAIIPKPSFSIFKVSVLLNNVRNLHLKELEIAGITCNIITEPASLELSADEKLIEQVLINLVKNSIHALEKKQNGFIELKAYLNKRGRVCVQAIDNGQGIIPEVIDKVFIPFFSTKPRGSGIGLSWSRQILRQHGGNISVVSEPDKGTKFTLVF